MGKEEFHTFRKDMESFEKSLTASMEDYLEMIYRLSREDGYTRIFELSNALNVQPPSTTKMVQKLAKLKLLNYERYGVITLEDKGEKLGKTLLSRHVVIETFLTMLGASKKEIFKETERIEHTISNDTLTLISSFTKFIGDNSDILVRFNEYKNKF